MSKFRVIIETLFKVQKYIILTKTYKITKQRTRKNVKEEKIDSRLRGSSTLSMYLRIRRLKIILLKKIASLRLESLYSILL